MTEQTAWRPMSPEEAGVIQAIVSAAGIRRGDALIEGLDGALIEDLDAALASNSAPCILDVKASGTGEGAKFPDGPFPARAFVPSSAAYQGEIIIWLTDGHVSGLEYAWITDEPPTRWPRPDEMEVVSEAGF
jgi:hypothetical protein